MDKKVTIVMTYWNRKKQLINTFKSLEQYGDNVNVIVVDDASTDGEDIHCFENDHIKVITMENKTWINPCIPFNTGFSEAAGDIIIIQNSECIHNGDIIAHALANIQKGIYISYSALAVNEFVTDKITCGENINETISPFLNNRISDVDWDGNGWYNHPEHRSEGYHFCAAITREDLYSLGGFDERYRDGLGFDDNELLHRIKSKGMKIQIIERPFVVHQAHPKFTPGDVSSLMSINAIRYEATKATNEYDMKPYNTIYK